VRLGNTKTQDWGFINDFQWVGATKIIALQLLGMARPPPHWSIECTTAADPPRLSTDIEVRIEIQPCHMNIAGQLESRPGWVTQHRRGVHNMDIQRHATVSDKARYLGTVLESVLFEMGPFLYEHDPRIGHQGHQGPLPVSPMLDPPGRWSREPQFGPPDYTCPLCDQEIDDFMWGGGNLTWVHPECWRNA